MRPRTMVAINLIGVVAFVSVASRVSFAGSREANATW